jgi:hypothetical protein
MNQNQLMSAVSFGTTDPAAIAAAEGAKARIQAAYIMALQKPRNEDQARVNIIEACKRPQFAKLVEFSKPVAGKKIRGPSIRFAELALREWGNIDSDIQVVFEDEQIRRVKVRELDLERNSSFSADVNIKKIVERKNAADREVVAERMNTQGQKVFIVLATEDEFSNKAGSLISKAIRNEGLRLIPQDIIDEAIATARQTLADEDARDPNAAKKAVLDSFATIGIKLVELERYLNHGLDTMSPAEREDLRGVYRAIRDGESTWQEFVKPKDEPKPPAPVVDPETGEVIDPYKAKKTPADLKETDPAGTSTTKSTPSQDEDDPAAYKAKVAQEVYDRIYPTRKLFAEHVKTNIEIIRDDMTPIQRAGLKTKWLRSARDKNGLNGVKHGERWPLDKPEEQETAGEDMQGQEENAAAAGEQKQNGQSTNGKTNGFKFCVKLNKRIPESVCEDCPDRSACEERDYFLKECKIFDDMLGGIVFQAVLREIAGVSDPKQVPPDQFQAVLIKLNEAVDQKNA